MSYYTRKQQHLLPWSWWNFPSNTLWGDEKVNQQRKREARERLLFPLLFLTFCFSHPSPLMWDSMSWLDVCLPRALFAVPCPLARLNECRHLQHKTGWLVSEGDGEKNELGRESGEQTGLTWTHKREEKDVIILCPISAELADLWIN